MGQPYGQAVDHGAIKALDGLGNSCRIAYKMRVTAQMHEAFRYYQRTFAGVVALEEDITNVNACQCAGDVHRTALLRMVVRKGRASQRDGAATHA